MDEDTPARPRTSRTAWIVIAVLGILGVVQGLLAEPPVKQSLLFDERRYRLWATNLADRGFYGDEAGKWPATVELRSVSYSAYVPPGYPFFLAFFREVFGSFRLVQLAQALLVGLTIAVTSWIALRLFGSVAAVAAGLLLLAIGVLPTYAPLYLTEVLATALLVVAVALSIHAYERSSWVMALAAGVVLGVGALVRPQLLLLPIPFALWALLAWGSRRAGAKAGAAIILGTLIVAVPWMVRNEARLGRLVPISTYTWVNFFIVNNADATGQFQIPEKFIGADKVREIRSLPEVEQDDAWRRLSLDYVRDHPGEAIRGWFRNGRIYVSEPDVVMDIYYGFRGERPPRLDERILEVLAGIGFLVALGVRRFRRSIWPLLIVVAYFIVFFSFFLPEGRYRVPMLPMMAILASVIPALLWRLFERGRAPASDVAPSAT